MFIKQVPTAGYECDDPTGGVRTETPSRTSQAFPPQLPKLPSFRSFIQSEKNPDIPAAAPVPFYNGFCGGPSYKHDKYIRWKVVSVAHGCW